MLRLIRLVFSSCSPIEPSKAVALTFRLPPARVKNGTFQQTLASVHRSSHSKCAIGSCPAVLDCEPDDAGFDGRLLCGHIQFSRRLLCARTAIVVPLATGHHCFSSRASTHSARCAAP